LCGSIPTSQEVIRNSRGRGWGQWRLLKATKLEFPEGWSGIGGWWSIQTKTFSWG